MRKIFITIFIFLYFINKAFSEDFSSIIINKFFQEGKKICEEGGYGEYLLTNNPVTSVDISNDQIKDFIINPNTQRCEKSYSYLAGGSGGNNFVFLINPSLENIKNFDPFSYINDKENKITTMLIYDYELINWKGKTAIKTSSHGVACNVAGYIGCYTIFLASDEGFEIVEGPKPNPQ